MKEEDKTLNKETALKVINKLSNANEVIDIQLNYNKDNTTKATLEKINTENLITLENVNYSIDEDKILSDINIYVPFQSCVVILGISGSGKSTLLRIMAGLTDPNHGNITIMGKDLSKMFHKDRLRFINQNISFVFQDGGLINNLTVYENLTMPLRYYGKYSKKQIKDMIDDILLRFDLKNIKDRLPGKLSQGQKKFAGLARAFLLEPKILYLDEPSSNIDVETSERIIEMIRKYIILGGTVISVTSDMIFANSVASILGIIDEGKIIEYGSPAKVKISKNKITKKVIKNIYKEADLADEILKLLSE
jgi:phospholipid/cholesterol/gamma-HCH transport system ATP-binding protein